MRKNYLLPAAIALLAGACKKETKEIINSQPPESGNISTCYGNTWTADQGFDGHSNSPSLVYNNKVYFFNSPVPDITRIYDGTNWTSKLSAIPLSTDQVDFAFVIGNKGYLGNTRLMNGCYEYDFAANTWTQKANFPGPVRSGSSVFSIGNKGYIAAGHEYQNGNDLNYDDTWEYNPATNTWTQKASFPFLYFGRFGATGFSIGNKGYIVNGRINFQGSYLFLNSLLEYDPSTNAWSSKAAFPGDVRAFSKTFVISGFGYAGGGLSYASDSFKDFYRYNPVNDTWTKIPTIPVTGYLRQCFSINSRGYIAWEYQNNPYQLKIEKYTPLTCPFVQ